jgi:hypothetical protein
MSDNYTATWKRLFQRNCSHWTPRDRLRYVNIPNDPEDVDAEELEASKELIREINGTDPLDP